MTGLNKTVSDVAALADSNISAANDLIANTQSLQAVLESVKTEANAFVGEVRSDSTVH